MRRKGDRVAGTVHAGEYVIARRGQLLHITADSVTPIDLDDSDEGEGDR